MVVAGLFRHIAVHQPARRLEIEHRDLRLKKRCLDPLAFAGFLAAEKRQQNALRGEAACREVGDRDPDPHRPSPGRR